MGLEIHFRSPRTTTLEISAVESIEDWLQEFADIVGADTYRFEEKPETTWQVFFHPAEEPFTVTLHPETIEGYARTSNAGPGYHQFVTRILDEAESRWGINWIVNDDTNYFQARSRIDLEHTFANWMLARNKMAYESITVTKFSMLLGMPVDVQPIGLDYDILTPLGPRNKAWLEHLSNENTPVSRLSREFPWWSNDIDWEFWANLGIAHCYLNVIWEPTESEEAISAAQQAYDAFWHALELQPDADLPWPEWSRLAELLEKPEEIERIKEAKAYSPQRPFFGGYRLGNLRHQLDGGWEIQLPGSWYDVFDDDDQNLRFIRGEQSFFFTAFSKDGADDPIIDLDFNEGLQSDLEWDHDELHGVISIENSSEGWLLQALVTHRESIAMATFWSPDNAQEHLLVECAQTIDRSSFAELDGIKDPFND